MGNPDALLIIFACFTLIGAFFIGIWWISKLLKGPEARLSITIERGEILSYYTPNSYRLNVSIRNEDVGPLEIEGAWINLEEQHLVDLSEWDNDTPPIVLQSGKHATVHLDIPELIRPLNERNIYFATQLRVVVRYKYGNKTHLAEHFFHFDPSDQEMRRSIF